MMDTYSKNRTTDRNNVGRPIIVYDDDSGEKNNDTPNSSSGIIFNILLRFVWTFSGYFLLWSDANIHNYPFL